MPSHKSFPLLAPMNREDRTATVYRWMIRNALRHAGIDYRENGALPMPDETADYLGTLAHRYDTYPALDDYKRIIQIERQIESATRFVVDTFSVEYLEQYTQRARHGYVMGISKARVMGTGGVRVSPHLEWFCEHPEAWASEAARERHITRRQASRLKLQAAAENAQRQDAEGRAELDRLFPETVPDTQQDDEDITEMLDRLFPMSIPAKPSTPVEVKATPLPHSEDLSPSQPVRVHTPTPAGLVA